MQVAQVSVQFHMYTYLHLHMQLRTTTTDQHHTVQVARVQVQYLRQWLDEKEPPVQVAEGDVTTHDFPAPLSLKLFLQHLSV